MILQALKEYYDRKLSQQENLIAPEGFEERALDFLIVIDEQGKFINIEDTRERINGKLVAKTFLVPRSKGRSGPQSYKTTFLLWDHIGYLLGFPASDVKSAKQHGAWLSELKRLPPELLEDAGVNAMIQFYKKDGVAKVLADQYFLEHVKSSKHNLSFRLASDVPVPCRDKVREFVKHTLATANTNDKEGVCLVTGEQGVIARTHNSISLNKDSKSLVGFQKNSGYDSYKKEQGYNAPIIESTEFAYVTALNSLLKSKSQCFKIGDLSMVFWSSKDDSSESDFIYLFKDQEEDNPGKATDKVKSLFKSINDGAYYEDGSATKFYLLGLLPNMARISIQFWQVGTISEIATHIRQHFKDFAISKSDREPLYYVPEAILADIAIQGEIKNIPSYLAGDFMKSILDGTPYPAGLLQLALMRIQNTLENRVPPVRAALIKAYLNRYYRFNPDTNYREVGAELDTTQPSIAYHLGRLFAILEKIQQQTQRKPSATIRERFYGTASTMPAIAFATLLDLKEHHLKTIKNNGKIATANYLDRLLVETMSSLGEIPVHLNLHEQGMFAVGYYHQRKNFLQEKEII
jgi:CRISPR-associated protein Csd1